MYELTQKFPYQREFFQVFSHPDCLHHETGSGHPESTKRLQSIYDGCKLIEDKTRVSFSMPAPAMREQLELVHDKNYLLALESSCMKMKPFFMSGDNQICMDTYTAVLSAGGSVFSLADTIMNGSSGFALIRPPGHHAGVNVAEGFCYINHIALAIEHIRQKQPEARFLVVDFDVHHGNGIDSIYSKCDKVFYFSIHGSPEHIYPNTGRSTETGQGTGVGFTHNIPLLPGTSGDIWLDKFVRGLYAFEGKLTPDYILVSAGFDAHLEDPFGLMGVEDHHYLSAIDQLQAVANTYCGGKLALFLEGGYSLEVLKRIVPKIICQLAVK